MGLRIRDLGGLSQYNVIDRRVLDGDHGNYFIPVQSGTGYAESALTEPWACVIAAYQLQYRGGLKPGGVTWIIGSHAGDLPYTISAGFEKASHPGRLLLTDVPASFDAWLRERAKALGVEVVEVDDIVLLGADPDLIETVSPFLADFGIVAIVAGERLSRKVEVDVGRVHYNRWLYVGGSDPDVARAYAPVRSTLEPGGRADGAYARPARHPDRRWPRDHPVHRHQRYAPG